jgi:hypothetical protein
VGKEACLIDKIPLTMLQAYGILEKKDWAGGIDLKGKPRGGWIQVVSLILE